MGSNKIALAVFALIAVCTVSFFAVRALTSGEASNNPVINVQTVPYSTTENTTEAPATQPSEATTAAKEQTSDTALETIDVNKFTTNVSDTKAATEKSTTAVSSAPLSTTVAATDIVSPSQVVTSAAQTTAAQQTTAAATDSYIQEASKSSDGFLGYLYDQEGNYYYTNSDPWQRSFGFNAAYDIGAQFVFMFYDTARIKFTYAEKDWMVQLWKGQYGGVFIGAEIGVYNKPVSRTLEHYDCASNEDALFMAMTFYKNGEPKGNRNYAKYWWCTLFIPGKLKKYSDRSELALKAQITLKDKDMLNAFLQGMKDCKEFSFVKNENYTVKKLDVFITW